MRQPDETTCFTCGSTIKRDAQFCPQCSAEIATGPGMEVRSFEEGVYRPKSHAAAEADVAGAGRYILNFLLAGVIGLGLTYVLRTKGWLATWICIPIFILVVVVLASVGSSP